MEDKSGSLLYVVSLVQRELSRFSLFCVFTNGFTSRDFLHKMLDIEHNVNYIIK